MAENLIEEFYKTADCKICFGRLNNPKLLPCAHSFCKQCLDGLLKFNEDGSGVVYCPNRCDNGVANISVDETTEVLPRSYELLDFIELVEKNEKSHEHSICQHVTCKRRIQFLCAGCKSKYCEDCFQNHICERKQRFSIFFDENNEDYLALCEQHQSAALIVCKDCENQLMCTYCFHRNHDRKHLHESFHKSADSIRHTLKSDLKVGSEYYSKTNFSYNDQLRRIQQLGNQLEVESKAIMARKVADYSKHLAKEHENRMNQFNASVISYHEYLEDHEHLNGNMMEVVDRFEEKIDGIKDVSLIADKWNIVDEVIDVTSIKCFSVQLNETSTGKVTIDMNTPNVSVKTNENIEPISSNLNDLEESENELKKSLDEIQSSLASELLLRKKEEEFELYKHFAVHPEEITIEAVLQTIENKFADILELIVKKEEKLIYKNASTFLHRSVENGFTGGIKLILNVNKTVINSIGENGQTVLEKACVKGFHSIVILLLDNGASMNNDFPVNSFFSPFKIVTKKSGQDESMSVGTNSVNAKGQTALMVAAENGNIETVKLLMDRDAEIDIKAIDGQTALILAARYGHLDVVNSLLEKKADIDMKANSGYTALYVAAQNGHLEVIKFLLEKHANIDVQTNNGCTALYIAAEKGHLEVIKFLVEKHADIDMKKSKGFTALMVAAQNGHLDVVKLLLQKNANIDTKQNDGWTALMLAAQNGHLYVVNLLLQKNAKIDMKQNDGYTALMIAAQNGHLEVVKLLLQKNANIDVKTNRGSTALMIAKQHKRTAIIALLEISGA